MRIIRNFWMSSLLVGMLVGFSACGGTDKGGAATYVGQNGEIVDGSEAGATEALPFTPDVKEKLTGEPGAESITIEGDATISHPESVVERERCFIIMSKKDYYLYVYEPQGDDTVMVARFDCCFSRVKGQKQGEGDMRTPHCTMDHPFSITQIADASTWEHDFGDGRGPIKSYGNYFLRLETPGHKGIGIHGSTNNEESVPGRASEGCIRLHDADIIELAEKYAFVGMKVVIKEESADDLPFEVRALKKQQVARKRHLPVNVTQEEQP